MVLLATAPGLRRGVAPPGCCPWPQAWGRGVAPPARHPWLRLQWACHSAGGCDGCAKAQPRGATPHPRSGAEAGRTPCPQGGGQEELPHVRGQGQRPRVPDFDGTGTAERSYPASEVGERGGAAERSYPVSEVRGGGQESLVNCCQIS